MMLGPEDVDDLIKNEGMSTDMIDELRKFYNIKIKNRTLDQLLDEVEQVIEMDKI